MTFWLILISLCAVFLLIERNMNKEIKPALVKVESFNQTPIVKEIIDDVRYMCSVRQEDFYELTKKDFMELVNNIKEADKDSGLLGMRRGDKIVYTGITYIRGAN